ncbi:MAG: cbb3-type cytochrome c oxidase subunit I, partial [Limisphaerales bacterium]
QWFLFAALFIFPWIFSTASLLLVFHPVRGIFQAAVNFWFSHNFQTLWLGSIGIAAIFYFIPKIIGRPLYSHYLAGFSFWLLLIFGGWGGIPAYAPLPAWMSSLSTVTNIVMLVTIFSLAINWYFSFVGADKSEEDLPLRFIKFGAICYLLHGFIRVGTALRSVSQLTQFTHFDTALSQLGLYGFFAMTIFGAIYFIVPRLTNMNWPSATLAKTHYWCSAFGIALMVIALGLGGILQGYALGDARVEFIKTVKITIPFIGVSTLAGLLLLIGHTALLWNLSVMLFRYCRLHFIPKTLFEAKMSGGNA